jgi:phage shock protein PspC (stress-responsive transcriptional regulator)
MNEITNIHLGRQPFTISAAAYKELQEYLQDIKHQVGASHKEVIEEIEIRMAELLTERGAGGEKVVLPEDITYIKEQLGTPADFGDGDEADKQNTDQGSPKRLFRDTPHNAMIAGVSSGIAAYFNIDVVIVRLLFVIATFTGGWGIPLYLVLWLVVPEAKTSSEQLQMRGKAVTVDSIKQAVDQADVTGAAHRVSQSLVPVIKIAAKVELVAAGIFVAALGAALLAGIAMAGIYALIHGGHLIHGAMEFPIGTVERVAALGGISILVALSIFMLTTGVAMVRRKWSMPGWGLAAIITILLAGVVACGAAMPDTIQNLRGRYRATSHLEVRQLQEFKDVQVQQGEAVIPVHYEVGTQTEGYSVTVRYLGTLQPDDVRTTVSNDQLTIDTRQFKPGANWDCDGLCIGAKDYFEIVVRTPQPVMPPDMNINTL